MDWQPIETAPKDGRPVWLCTATQTMPDPEGGPDFVHPPRCAIGRWDPEGTSWVNEYGQATNDDIMTLGVTGIWESGGGWFQPNEVTHWMELPAPPSLQPAKQ